VPAEGKREPRGASGLDIDAGKGMECKRLHLHRNLCQTANRWCRKRTMESMLKGLSEYERGGRGQGLLREQLVIVVPQQRHAQKSQKGGAERGTDGGKGGGGVLNSFARQLGGALASAQPISDKHSPGRPAGPASSGCKGS